MDPRRSPLLRALRFGAALAGLVLSAPALALQPCAGFVDVDVDDPLCASVDWIRNRSITLGCAPAQGTSLYCPAAGVSRVQMAAFASRLAHALMPHIATQEETRAPVDLDAAVPWCVTPIAPTSTPRRASVDAVIAAVGAPAVGFVAEVVHTFDGGSTFVPTAPLPLPAHIPQGGGWANVHVRGTLVIPAGVSAQVAARARRGAFAGPADLAQGQCTLRVMVTEVEAPRAPRAVTLGPSLSSPWGLTFLPDGRMLVTQKGGTMVIVSADGARVLANVSGVPPVDASGQGGLLDVALDPDADVASDPWVYWTFSEPGPGGAGTAVARGRLVGSALQDVAVIFRQVPKVSGGGHYGARLAFRPDGTLLVSLGERQLDNPSSPTTQYAQSVSNHLGKVVRIQRDGGIPAGNPDFGAGAQPALWSIGHRNPQGAAIHPSTGELWLVEHGPQGGDELNRVASGGNYGWPLRSYGCPYGAPVGDACRVGGGIHAPQFVEPASYWVPTSIAPAGMIFYTGDRFPEWHGNVLFGALAGTALWRVTLAGNAVSSRERLFGQLGERIRHVRQGPDGWIYLLTDSGKLIRIER
jgi:glucose/arabinose dehydrogenase